MIRRITLLLLAAMTTLLTHPATARADAANQAVFNQVRDAIQTDEKASAAEKAGKPQYYEVRIYHTKSAEQQQRINDYWQNAAVPAYNRQGIQPIGVFTEIEEAEKTGKADADKATDWQNLMGRGSRHSTLR